MAIKILVLSDVHLDEHFNPSKLRYLMHIIGEHDRVILNGDFYDDWFLSWEEFLVSKWAPLFPLLMQKQTIYINGNHDEANGHSAIGKFCVKQCYIYDEKIGNFDYHFEHGFEFLLQKEIGPALKFYMWTLSFRNSFWFHFLHFLEILGYRFIPEMLTNSKFSLERNQFVKNHYSDFNTDGFVVIGHTHAPELDIQNKFANSGAVLHGYASYLTITEDGIKLHKNIYSKHFWLTRSYKKYHDEHGYF